MEINEIIENGSDFLEFFSDSLNWATHNCEEMKKGRKLHLWQRDVSFNFQPIKGIHSVPTVKVNATTKMMRAVIFASEMHLYNSQSA